MPLALLGVVGGMISATLFNNLFVPPFYVILQGFSDWLGRSKRGRATAEGRAGPSTARNDGPVTEPGI